MMDPSTAVIQINRPALTLQEFDVAFQKSPKEKEPLKSKIKAKCTCSKTKCVSLIFHFLPAIKCLKRYKPRYIIPDIVAGVSVGLVHFAQGMAFALLAALTPIYGLYSSFFPVLLYFVFAVSEHVTVGTMALTSLMIGAVVERAQSLNVQIRPEFNTSVVEVGDLFNTTSGTDVDEDLLLYKAGIATSVSLLVGAFQLGMSFLRLGILATFMPMSLVGGFTTAAACHITTSQLKHIFGLTVTSYGGMLKLPLTIIDVFRKIGRTNVATLVAAIICLLVLIVIKEVINVKFKKRLPIPIPADALLVAAGTIISHFADLNGHYNIRIAGSLPRGFPAPQVPHFDHVQDYAVDGFVIAIVSFVMTISMARLFAEKHQYDLDANQELLAYGISHSVSAFFHCFAGACAPPRSFVFEACNGKTRVANVVSSIWILIIILFIANIFESLPVVVLACITIVALFPLFRQFKDLVALWKINKYDCFIWIVTFLSVVILDFGIGIGIGFVFAMLTVMFQSHLAKGEIVVKLRNTGIFCNKRYKAIDELPCVSVFKFNGPLIYTNTDSFKKQLWTATLNPVEIKKAMTKAKAKEQNQHSSESSNIQTKSTAYFKKFSNCLPRRRRHHEYSDTNGINNSGFDQGIENAIDKINLESGSYSKTEKNACITENKQKTAPDGLQNFSNTRSIVIDCSSMTYVDVMGIRALQKQVKDYGEIGVQVALASCTEKLLSQIKAAQLSATFRLFPSLPDAVALSVSGKPEDEGLDDGASGFYTDTRL